MWPIAFDTVAFDEAIAWFRGKVPMLRGDWDALSESAKQKAFTVSQVAQLDVVQAVCTAVDQAVADGTTLQDFQREVRDTLSAAWAGSVESPAWRMETIFRTNVQTAYSAGRWRELQNPAVKDSHPFLRFDAILDSRVTATCKACNGTLLAADATFWKTHVPPLHFNCRSALVPLTEETAAKLGVTAAPSASAQEGFGLEPDVAPWAPDLSVVAPDLRELFLAKEEAHAADVHTAAFWRATYAHLGDAAAPTAWGRAAEERGLDLPLEEIDRALGLVRAPVLEDALAFAVLTRAQHPDVKTLRDALRFVDADHTRRRGSLRLGAALAAHRLAITPVGKLEAKVSFPRDPARKAIAQSQYARAERFLSAVIAKGLHTGPLKLSFSADARGYFSETERKIVASGSPRVIEHEWGHALEAFNPKLGAEAVAFYKARTEGDRLESLRALTGRDFGPHEKARPDAFFNPYVGKEYAILGKLVATEVTSMGLETLASPEAGVVMETDPEHLYFTLGQIAGVTE